MMGPISSDQFRASTDGSVPGLERIADGVWSLGLAIPPGRMPYTLAYLLEDDARAMHLIDAGWGEDENLDRIAQALAQLPGGGAELASVTVTHLHPDHLGLAECIRERYGVPVIMHAAEEAATWAIAEDATPERQRALVSSWGTPAARADEVFGYLTSSRFPTIRADQHVEDGALLAIPGRRVRVMHTPGHTVGHLCFVEEDERLLFAGDHLLPTVYPGVGLGGTSTTNPLEDYLRGLERTRTLDDCAVLPGHGYAFRGAAERSAVLAQRHLHRLSEVAAALATTPEASTWEIASQLSWSKGWEGLTRHYLTAALKQTAMHVRLVREGRLADLTKPWT